MAGFHPAGRRIIAGDGSRQQHEDDIAVGEKPQHHDNSNDITIPKNDNDDIDEIESDFSSDYDQPYHESASNWYNRHARRRARLLAGISSSSSSSSSESSDESCSGFESDEIMNNGNNDGGQSSSRRNKLMEKTIQSANRPLNNWLASYPCVAARCCLSLPPAADADAATNYSNTNSYYHRGNNARTVSQLFNYNNNNNADSVSFLPARESETKILRRIFRRLRRKQTEFHVKFGGNSSSSSNPSASSSQPNTLSLGQQSNNNAAEATNTAAAAQNNNTVDQMALHSFIPRGIGISFIDAVLAREESAVSLQQSSAGSATAKQQQQQKSCSRLVLELNGPARSGMTSILIAMAARYVVSTSNIFVNGGGCSSDSDFDNGQQHYNGSFEADSYSHPNKRTKLSADGNYSTKSVLEPNVVILDLEKGVHTIKLILSVREAVLRRWEETTAARDWKKEQDQFWNTTVGGKEGGNNMTDANDAKQDAQDESSNDSTLEEQRQIEHAIASCLGRINVVQPRDFTYLSLVATIEALRHSLDQKQIPMISSTLSESSAKKRKQPTHPQQFGRPRKNSQLSQSTADTSSKGQQQAPTLILIDSLTTLDAATRFQESLPNTATGGNRSSGSNSGLSDRNEFYRQLIRLREEHEVAIVGASRCTATTTTATSTNRSSEQGLSWGGGKRGGGSRGNSLWDKMVSHRVNLHHVVEGTAEDRAGYDFVATLNNNSSISGTNHRHQEGGGASVFPYSVTAGGIAC